MQLSPIDRDLLIRTVVGEAGKEPLEGQAGVVYSVLNRMAAGKYGGKDVQGVLFHPRAYEPWDTRRSELLSYAPGEPQYDRAAAVVDAVLSGQIKDPTGGKTHFLNADVVKERRGGSLPAWAQGEGQSIGRHTFFAPEGAVQRVSMTEPVTDPEVLKALEGGAETAPEPVSTASPVTDPAILNQLGENIAPPVASGVPGAEATIATPIESGREIGAKGAFVQGFASNEQEALRYLASQLYPNEPIEQAVQRFGREGDVLYHVDDQGKRYRVNPEGLSVQGFLNNLAGAVGPSLAPVAGAATGIATAPLATTGVGLAGTIAATAGAAGAAEYGRQKLGDVMMGEAATGTVSPLGVLSEALMATGGQGTGGAFSTFYTRKAVRDLARLDPVATADAYNAAKGFGITLTPAEATGLASLKAQQKRLANMFETADDMAAFTTRRDGEVVSAWENFMDAISTSGRDAENVGRLARSTAGEIIAGIRRETLKAARPLYKQAYEEGDRVLWSPELERLSASPAVQDAMQGAVKTWQDDAIADGFGAMNPGALVDDSGVMKITKGKVPAFPNLQFWDYVKRRLDGQISAAIDKGDRGKVRTLTALASKLRGELDTLTTVNGQSPYAQARRVYGTGADEVGTAMDSALGLLEKTKDVNILQAARTIFNPQARSPQMVTKLRYAIEDQNPVAWQALKRLYIQDVTTDALRIAQTGDVINPAGKLHQAFMSPRTQDNLRAAMTVDEWTHFKGLLAVLKRASSVPALRSDTAFNLWAREAEQQAAEPYWSKIVGAGDPQKAIRLWIPQIREWATERNLERQGRQMVEAITSGDPQAINALKELRRLSPWDRRWTMLFGHLLARGAVYGGQMALSGPEADFEPGTFVGAP